MKRVSTLLVVASAALGIWTGTSNASPTQYFCFDVLLAGGQNPPSQSDCVWNTAYVMYTWSANSTGSALTCTALRNGPYTSSGYSTQSYCTSVAGGSAGPGTSCIGCTGYPSLHNHSTYTSRFRGRFNEYTGG